MKNKTKLHILPLLETNYCYFLANDSKAIVVDPGESRQILSLLKKEELTLSTILLTHNHNDHCGGMAKLLEEYPEVNIINYESKDKYIFNGQLSMEIILTPGHTQDSCCFYFPDLNYLFTGDTLFTGLCGRVISGSFDQMFDSLKKLRSLPKNTLFYPGHEYLENSIKFISIIGLDTSFYKAKLQYEFPSLNLTISDEIRHNPFMTDDFNRFKTLREQKG